MNNIKASRLRVSALRHATADVAVRATIPRHEGRKPRAESRARYPNPGFLPNPTLAMTVPVTKRLRFASLQIGAAGPPSVRLRGPESAEQAQGSEEAGPARDPWQAITRIH